MQTILCAHSVLLPRPGEVVCAGGITGVVGCTGVGGFTPETQASCLMVT